MNTGIPTNPRLLTNVSHEAPLWLMGRPNRQLSCRSAREERHPRILAYGQQCRGSSASPSCGPDGSETPGSPVIGQGLVVPWALAVDGNGHVWVSNF